MAPTPQQKPRKTIGGLIIRAGWETCVPKDANITVHRSVAIRKFPPQIRPWLRGLPPLDVRQQVRRRYRGQEGESDPELGRVSPHATRKTRPVEQSVACHITPSIGVETPRHPWPQPGVRGSAGTRFPPACGLGYVDAVVRTLVRTRGTRLPRDLVGQKRTHWVSAFPGRRFNA